jgi:hypothetical protein
VGVTDGTLLTRTLVVDTDVEKIVGDGSIDFAKERYDLTLNAKSKRPSLLALRGPIVVEGTFAQPRVHPAVGPLIARLGASVALGAALTPLAALLPLIDPGGHSDVDCGALIDEARRNIATNAEKAKSVSPAR